VIGAVLGSLLAIPLLGLLTFVQVLYLESLRLRTRDLPSIKFFKEVLEERIGIKTDEGADTFSLIKHALLIVLGIAYYIWFGESFWEALLAALLTMIAVCFALPQLLYRRTSGRFLLPLVAVLKLLAWIARPFVAALKFFQSLVDLTDDTGAQSEEPTPAENIEATVKIRYNHPGTAATVTPLDGQRAMVKLHVPQRAITPGQAAVFYQDDLVLGGGWITR